MYIFGLYSLKVKRGTVNTLMYVRFMLKAHNCVYLILQYCATAT
jgi:hypothetical protein